METPLTLSESKDIWKSAPCSRLCSVEVRLRSEIPYDRDVLCDANGKLILVLNSKFATKLSEFLCQTSSNIHTSYVTPVMSVILSTTAWYTPQKLV